MNKWEKTKYEGVYVDLRAARKGSPAKFSCVSQWRGKQYWRSGFTSLTQARNARVRLKSELMETDGKLESRRLPVSTFGKMIDELVKHGDVRKAASQTGRVRYSVLYSNHSDYSLFGMCIDYLAKHNRKHFSDAVSVVGFAKWMRSTRKSERTIEMCLRLLHVVYGMAMSRGLYKFNPVIDARSNEVLAKQLRKIPQERKNPAMRKFLTPAERQKICEVVKTWRDPRAVWVGMNVWLGLRPSVFNKIRWDDPDMAAGLLWVRPEVHKSPTHRKSGEASPSFIPAEAKGLIEHYANRLGFHMNGQDFIDQVGNAVESPFLSEPLSRSTMRRTWRAVLKKAGVEYAAPYAARVTMINEMLDAGVNVKDVATHSGNTPATIYKYYVKPSTARDIQNIPAKLHALRAA